LVFCPVDREAGAAVGHGEAVKELRTMEAYKKQKNLNKFVVLFNINVDLKNNYRKPF